MTDGPGIVYLVGAGPGDPGLMTTRSLELIVAADVIVHDRLIPSGSLALARPDAELLYVGKEPGSASVGQDEIADLLIDRARQGKIVVRLKGGDPFVFGRGGEEAEELVAAGVRTTKRKTREMLMPRSEAKAIQVSLDLSPSDETPFCC